MNELESIHKYEQINSSQTDVIEVQLLPPANIHRECTQDIGEAIVKQEICIKNENEQIGLQTQEEDDVSVNVKDIMTEHLLEENVDSEHYDLHTSIDIKEESSKSHLEYTRGQIFEIIKKNVQKDANFLLSELEEHCRSRIKGHFEINSASNAALRDLISKIKARWLKSHRTRKRFLITNKNWLDVIVIIANVSSTNSSEDSKSDTSSETQLRRKRPSTDIRSASDRTKRRRTETVRADDVIDTSDAAEMNDTDVTSTYSTRARAVKPQTTFKDASKSTPSEISADVALNLIITGKMNKETYELMRQVTNENRGTSVYPSYHKIISAKVRCYPSASDITITETLAEVKLQALLNHTSDRLLQAQLAIIKSLDTTQTHNFELILKWGCDGCSDQQYKHKINDKPSSDTHVSFASIVPLKLVVIDSKFDKEIVLWKNLRPSSLRFCRPIRFQFLKENVQSICNEKKYIEDQIASLVPFYTVIDGKNITVNFKMAFTMIDGKVRNAITGIQSALRCYICEATSKDYNKIDLVLKKNVKKENLQFGIESLHAWIRCMEWLLQIAYQLDEETAKRKTLSETDEKKVAERKREIQKELKNTLGLRIDIPTEGAGTTNDGNTARRFFDNVSLTAKILRVDEDLIANCKVILQAISSGIALDTEKFRRFSLDIAKQYVKLYPWYPMPTSIHILLIHGYAIMDTVILPIERLSEDAQESRNKDIKRHRECFSRKISREKTMSDVFHRLLVSSDPLISTLQKQKTKFRSSLPPKVLELFVPEEVQLPDENSVDVNKIDDFDFD